MFGTTTLKREGLINHMNTKLREANVCWFIGDNLGRELAMVAIWEDLAEIKALGEPEDAV